MGLDSAVATSQKMRWAKWTWLAADILFLGACSCIFWKELWEISLDFYGAKRGYVEIPVFLPWLSGWIYFIFWRRFSDVLAKALAWSIGAAWGFDCFDGFTWNLVFNMWDRIVTTLMATYNSEGAAFLFVWLFISWLLGGVVLWTFLRIKRWFAMKNGDGASWHSVKALTLLKREG